MKEMMSEDDTRVWTKKMRGLRVSKHMPLLLRHGHLYITHEHLGLVPLHDLLIGSFIILQLLAKKKLKTHPPHRGKQINKSPTHINYIRLQDI